MTIVDEILQQDTLPKTQVNDIASWVASFFSGIFSLSIVKEASTQIQDPIAFGLIFVFTILFLVYNEYIKVTELRKWFTDKKGSIPLIVCTFLITVSLSGIGIYFLTNHTVQTEITNDATQAQRNSAIAQKYNHVIDSLSNTQITQDATYVQLKSDLQYWHQRTAGDIEDRRQIREHIKDIETNLRRFEGNFSKKKEEAIQRYKEQKIVEENTVKISHSNVIKSVAKDNYISLIFFVAVLLTKFIIILLSKQYAAIRQKKREILSSTPAQNFYTQYKFLTEVLSRKNEIKFDDIVFSPYFTFSKNKERRTKEVKAIYYLFGDLKLLNCPLEEAQLKLKTYYIQIL